MGAYYPSLTSPTSIPSSPLLLGQKVASLQSFDLPDNMIYLHRPSTVALHPQLLYASSFSAHSFVEDHSVGSRDEMPSIPQNGDPESIQPIGGQLNITPGHSDGNTAMLDPQIFSQKTLDARNEGLHFQGLSVSLETQIPSSVQMSSYRNHYTSPCHSLLMSSSFVNAEEQGSRNSEVKNAEYLSFDLAGGTHNIANIGAVRNAQFSISSKEANPASHWHQVAGVSGNIYNSKYFKAASGLLDEAVNIRGALKQSFKRQKFHSLGGDVSEETDLKSNSHSNMSSTKMSSDPHNSATKPPSELSPNERHNLHSKMTKLLSMLEEVDRRYRQYDEQIQVLASSFEMVVGSGAANQYTGLALQTISCQFRRLRDAIKRQIQVTQHCLREEGETENSEGGELPRLRYIDQKLRQQRALQQFGIARQPWRPQKGLPETAVSILRAWLFEHFLNPYPKDLEKIMLAKQTGLTRNQVANWFINARVRLWKPMIEEMYKEEFGDAEADSQNSLEHEQITVTEKS